MILAIDGPAGSGKSTTAREVARQLGFLYVDTGAMYRAAALHHYRTLQVRPQASILDLVEEIDIQFAWNEDPARVILNGEDVTMAIRTPEISALSSRVAREAKIRAAMVEKQREIVEQVSAEGGGAVVEGRDIGTVVFPRAELKVFLHADPRVRAKRRQRDLEASGRDVSEADVMKQLADRDDQDTTREVAPLRAAPDAVHLDTSKLSFEEQVAQIVAWAQERVKGQTPVQST